MDTVTAAILVIIIFALIIIAAFVIFPNVRAKITGPFKTGLNVEGSRNNDAPSRVASDQAAIRARDIKSRSGGLMADDQTGRGVDAEQVEVEDDVLLSSGNLSSERVDPKVNPPT